MDKNKTNITEVLRNKFVHSLNLEQSDVKLKYIEIRAENRSTQTVK